MKYFGNSNKIKRLKVLFFNILLIIVGYACGRPIESDSTNSDEKNRLPSGIRTEVPYLGKIDGHACLLRFTEIDGDQFKGVFYNVGDHESGKPFEFKGEVKKKKLLIYSGGLTYVFKRTEVMATDSTFSGSGHNGSEEHTASFAVYKEPEYKVFKKRYRDEFFDYEVIKDIRYGTAMGYWTSKEMTTDRYFKQLTEGLGESISERNLDLKMDLYLPKGDYLKERPLIMFIHGGAFYIGDKEDNPIVLWCKHYASMGYVVASINYRMGFRPSKQAIERCGYRATQDAHAAMRYLVHYRETYRINPDYLFVAGSSAGGITALNLAFMRNADRPASVTNDKQEKKLGSIETSGNILQDTFHIKAICNMWGAVQDLSMLKNSRTDIISFHGDADDVVPYGHDIPFKLVKGGINKMFFNTMYGSSSVTERAKQLGYRAELHTFKGKGHAPHVDADNQPTKEFWYIQEKTTDFFANEIASEGLKIIHAGGQKYTAEVRNAEHLYWKVTGGVILQQSSRSVRIFWFRDAPVHSISVSGYQRNGNIVQAEEVIEL